MRKHSIPIPLLDTSGRSSLGKWRIASCALVLTLGQQICVAQSVGQPAQPASTAQTVSPDVIKELDAMKQRIEELEKQLAAKDAKNKDKDKESKQASEQAPAVAAPVPAAPVTTAQASAPVTTASATATEVHNVGPYASSGSFWRRFIKAEKASKPADTAPVTTASLGNPPSSAFDLRATDADAPFPAAQEPAPAAGTPAAPAAPAPVDNQTPFAFADFTWMNAVPRNHESVLDGKYFSGEMRVDTNYIYDYEHPIDHTLIGTTEGERTGEFVIQAVNVGGDFHYKDLIARVFTQFGAVSTAVPRNDASYSLGQWDLADAYRYLTEMYAGYHLNVQHGINIEVGDFLSFIGLFSYYSFDNWSYQPSYVSSNTPWFFTGMRVQWFPTNKLKIEPWLINGWQTYAKYNGREGLGGQILWRPTGNLDFVFNTYTLGRDVLGNPQRSRYHEDDSLEWKYYENPNRLMHRMAFSLTWDVGCESGGGVKCYGGNAATPSQNFLGIMGYQRFWFDHDHFGFTLGGGVMSNPGRYLVLLPPINGASATSGTPYFTENPGDKFRAYDYQITFDWMPSEFVTWRAEFTQRGADVPYFSGPGGITPQASPGLYVNEGAPGSYVPGFTPDLVKQERRWIFALMVHL